MADEDTVRLSNTPSSRSSLSSGSSSEDVVQPLRPSIDLTHREPSPGSHLTHREPSPGSHLIRHREPSPGNQQRIKAPPLSILPGGPGGFQCKLCTLVASSQSALDEHMNIHTGSRPYQCLECGFSCSLQSTLTQHLAVHRVEMSSSVLMRSPTMEEMQKSPRDQPPSLYPEVPRTLASLGGTGPPMLHSDDLIPVPAVPGPVGVFPDQSRIFQCKLCTHISPTKTHLNEHMNIHSGKKPYKCLVCGFSSAFRSSLMRHLIVHTGTSKQFKCDQCHYQTPYKCNLQAHRRKRHNSVENSEVPETTNSAQMPEISKVSTPNSNHSDDSRDGMGIYHPSDVSSVGFSFGQTSQAAMGSSDNGNRDNHANGPGEEAHMQEEAQETSTSGTTDAIIAGNENGYASAGPLQVCVDEPMSGTKQQQQQGSNGGSPGSGSGPSQEQGAYAADHHSQASFSPPVSTENGDATPDSAGGGMFAGGHEPTSTSASPIASLSQMATSHSPLTSESMPASSMWPSSAGFPIFIKKKREGAKKRKRTPLPKRDFVMSPEQEMWVDTRSEGGGGGRMAVENHPRPFFINLPGGGPPNHLKEEEHHAGVYPDQNGLDLTANMAREAGRRDTSLNNHSPSTGGGAIVPSITQEDTMDDAKSLAYPFSVYGNQVGVRGGGGAAKPPQQLHQVSTGTQTDQPISASADGKSQGEDIPPQASKCPHCETYFTDTVMFTLHMSCHGRIHPFQCGICGYMCGDKIEFTCHITRSKHLR